MGATWRTWVAVSESEDNLQECCLRCVYIHKYIYVQICIYMQMYMYDCLFVVAISGRESDFAQSPLKLGVSRDQEFRPFSAPLLA